MSDKGPAVARKPADENPVQVGYLEHPGWVSSDTSVDSNLVSIIMPFFNTPPAFMTEAIESVLAQLYPHWELWLIDDGSTRPSSRTAQKYASQYPDRIYYLEHEHHANKGGSASRQMAMRKAKGDFVAFLDADDVWLPHKLTEQVSLMQSQPQVGALYGNTKYWYSWTGLAEDVRRDYLPVLALESGRILEPPELLTLFIQGKVAIPCTCSIILRSDVVEKTGGFEESYSGIYDDQIFYAKVCLFSRVMVMHTCWDWYRQHPISGTHVAASRGQSASLHLTYLSWLDGYLHRQGVVDPAVWQALRREQWRYRPPAWLPQSWHGAVRWLKKWLLRAEAGLLPGPIRRRLWNAL